MARATTTGGSSEARRGAASDVGRDDLAGLESHLAGRLPDARELGLDFEVVASVDGREEVDRGVGAEQPLVAVPADEELGRRVAEEFQDEGAVHEPATVVRLLGCRPGGEAAPARSSLVPSSPRRREISSRRKPATREAVVPGPNPAS